MSSGATSVVVPGVYAELLEQEQRRAGLGDPRRVYANPADAAAGFFVAPSAVLRDLEAGAAVRVPSWRIGGRTGRDDRLRRLKRGDRTITGWLVSADDTVVALREGEG